MSDEQLKKREELQARLPKDCRTDAANNHVQAIRDVEGMTGRSVKNPYLQAYTSFLAGWDAAMKLDRRELLEEHMELHGIIMDNELKKIGHSELFSDPGNESKQDE